jgi:hypothetical protein
VNPFQQNLAAELERMMKLQDVLLKAMAKKITRWQAAEIIGVTERTMRRWRERSQTHGYSGLAESNLATGKERISSLTGWMHGDRTPTSERNRVHSL